MTWSKTMIGLTRGASRYYESPASGTLFPGELLTRDTDMKLKRHNVAGGGGPVLVAAEHVLDGEELMSSFEADDIVPHFICTQGAVMNMRIPAGSPAIVKSNLLMSNGTGGLMKVPTSGGGSQLGNIATPSTGVTNTVSTEQDFDRTIVIPANTLQAGDIVTIRGHAIVSAQASTDTIIVKVYIGTTVIMATTAVDAAANDVITWEITLVIRTAGASGTFVASFNWSSGVPGTATVKTGALASTAIDTTVAQTIKVTGTWSATNATNTLAVQSLSADANDAVGMNALFQAEESMDLSAEADSDLLPCLVL